MSRELNAYHEAGHAVAAIRLGVQVFKVAIAPDPDLDPKYAGSVWRAPSDPRSTAIIALAGLEAKRRSRAKGRPWAPEARADLWWGRTVMESYQGHDRDRAFVRGLTARDDEWWETFVYPTIEMVEGWCPSIEAVALALHRRGRLEREEGS